jgi:hypothetical protein
VGRAIQSFQISFQLADGSRNLLQESEPRAFDCTRWIEGQTYPFRTRVGFRSIPAGKYTLSCSVRTHNAKAIALPIKEQNADGSYVLGLIEVLP